MINRPIIIVVLFQKLVYFRKQLPHIRMFQMSRPNKMAHYIPQTFRYVQIIDQNVIQLLSKIHEIQCFQFQHLIHQIITYQIKYIIRYIIHTIHQRK